MKDPRLDPLDAVGLPPTIGVHQEEWTALQQTRSGQPSLSGRVQRIATPGLRWRASLVLDAPTRALGDWSAFLDRHEDGMRLALLGPLLRRFPARGLTSAGGGFSDATEFSDGTSFAEGGGAVLTVGNSPRGGNLIVVQGPGVASVAAEGQWLSFRARLMRVRAVSTVNANRVRLRVYPPLRQRIPPGTPLDYRPMARMQIETPGAGGVATTARTARTRWEVSFVEVPPTGSIGEDLDALPETWA